MTKDKTIEDLLKENVHYTKKQDVLLDVHVGNPLRRITQILEDIKKQKAFSFTLKGSLGVMGVVLVAGIFGLLGGSRVLCDKGVQTKSGTLKTLSFMETVSPSLLDYIPILSEFQTKPLTPRTVLMSSGQIYHVMTHSQIDITGFIGQNVLVSGGFDSCTNTLTVTDTTAVEPLN